MLQCHDHTRYNKSMLGVWFSLSYFEWWCIKRHQETHVRSDTKNKWHRSWNWNCIFIIAEYLSKTCFQYQTVHYAIYKFTFCGSFYLKKGTLVHCHFCHNIHCSDFVNFLTILYIVLTVLLGNVVPQSIKFPFIL